MGLLDPVTFNIDIYRAASQATRGWAKRRGLSEIKATKALSETTRNLIDEGTYRKMSDFSKPNQNITSGLKGLTSRLSEGNRSNRMQKFSIPEVGPDSVGTYFTHKGSAINMFGQHMGEQMGRTPAWGVRPKPEKVFTNTKSKLAAKRLAQKRASTYGPRG